MPLDISKRWKLSVVLQGLMITLFLAGGPCSVKIDRADLSGTVKDATRRHIAGAYIVTLQIATGL